MKSGSFSPDNDCPCTAPARPAHGPTAHPEQRVPPCPSQPWLSTEGPQTSLGCCQDSQSPRGQRGFGRGDEGSRAGCQGSSMAGMVDAGRVKKAAVPDPVPIPQWGLFWSPRAGCGLAGSMPDSHPRCLGGSWWRATSPAHLPTGLGHRMGTGRDPLCLWDPLLPHCRAAPSQTAPLETAPVTVRPLRD